jgi:hypothetical protein
LTCDYLREFSKKFETVLMQYSGAGGKLIHQKKNRSKKSRDTVPLRLIFICRYPCSKFSNTYSSHCKATDVEQNMHSCGYLHAYGIES